MNDSFYFQSTIRLNWAYGCQKGYKNQYDEIYKQGSFAILSVVHVGFYPV